jgi:hypothetical protein
MTSLSTTVHLDCQFFGSLMAVVVGLALITASALTPVPAILLPRHPAPSAKPADWTIDRPLAFLVPRDVVPSESAALDRFQTSATGSRTSRLDYQPGARLFLLGTSIQLHAPQTAALLRPPSEVPAHYRLYLTATPAPDLRAAPPFGVSAQSP